MDDDKGAKEEIDTINKFVVTIHGNHHVKIMTPPKGAISKADALLLAAWLVALADDHDRFPDVLAAVLGT